MISERRTLFRGRCFGRRWLMGWRTRFLSLGPLQSFNRHGTGVAQQRVHGLRQNSLIKIVIRACKSSYLAWLKLTFGGSWICCVLFIMGWNPEGLADRPTSPACPGLLVTPGLMMGTKTGGAPGCCGRRVIPGGTPCMMGMIPGPTTDGLLEPGGVVYHICQNDWPILNVTSAIAKNPN